MGDGHEHYSVSPDPEYVMIDDIISGEELCAMFNIHNRERLRQFRAQEGIGIIRIGGVKSRQAVYVMADVRRWQLALKRTAIARKAGFWPPRAYIRTTQFDAKCMCGGFALNYQGFHCENGCEK
jgi:hypothetical protein